MMPSLEIPDQRRFTTHAPRRATRRCIVLLALLSLGTSGIMAKPEDDELLEKGMALVREGAHRKAVKVLTRANAEAGGQSLPALLGLSTAHNGLEEHAQAYSLARQVLDVAQDANLRAAAAGELAHAISFGRVDSQKDELAEAVSEVRRFLTLEPAGSFSDGLRQRLCRARRQAGLTYPEGASSPLEVGDGVEKPVGIHIPQPSPGTGDHRHLSSAERVRIETVIDTDGCVASAKVANTTSEAWSRIVLSQIASWVFKPATRDGEAVAVNYGLTTTYSKR